MHALDNAISAVIAPPTDEQLLTLSRLDTLESSVAEQCPLRGHRSRGDRVAGAGCTGKRRAIGITGGR